MSIPGRILGIDYGSRRVGLAVSDPLQMIAQGAGTIGNTPDLAERIAAMVVERAVVRIVVGMPYGGEGEVGPKAREVEEFILALRRVVSVPLDTWDESFTSVGAQRALIDGGMKKKERREKGRVDEMAARLMLQEYLASRAEGHR